MTGSGAGGVAAPVPGAGAGAAASAPGAAARRPAAGGQARFGVVFAIVTAGIAVVNLDLFIVNVAIPSIGRGFGDADLSSLSWVLNAYAIVFAALLVPAGRAADLIGRRAAFLTGMIVFGLASAACAAAPDVWVLVVARVIQAAGGALLMPASLGLLLAAARPEKRTGTIRAWTSVGGAAAALGPVVGGALVEASWHWVFLVNVPVIAVAVAAGIRFLPAPPRASQAAGAGRRREGGAARRGRRRHLHRGGRRARAGTGEGRRVGLDVARADRARSPGPLPCWPSSPAARPATRPR